MNFLQVLVKQESNSPGYSIGFPVSANRKPPVFDMAHLQSKFRKKMANGSSQKPEFRNPDYLQLLWKFTISSVIAHFSLVLLPQFQNLF